MKRFLPITSWLPGYQRTWFRSDLIAGLTIMALLVPEGMAYAELAGVPPQAAFYAAPIGLLLYAVFGTSRQLVVAVSSGVAVMSASIVGEIALPDSTEFIALTAGLALLTGLVSVVAGLLRLGRIARFFSHSVLVGFVAGLALFIMVKQLPKIFGLESGEGNTIQRLIELIRDLPETHLATLIVGLSTVAVMLIVEKWFHRIPAALVALVFGILVVTLFDLDARGVHVVGEIPAGLAPPQIPDISFADVGALLTGAVALTLFVFAEAVGPAKSFASNHRYRIDENQELIGLGMSNFGAGLFQGFPIGASLSKSAASDAAGGRTQVSAVVAAVATALVALFLTPLFRNLPEAALGAIVVVAVSGMVNVTALRRLYRIHRVEYWFATTALVGVLVFEEVLAGLLVAVVVSLIALVARASSPRLSELVRLPGTMEFRGSRDHPEGLTIEGLLILRPDEEIFFANAEPLREAIRTALDSTERPLDVVVLDLSLSSGIDVPGAEMLAALAEELDRLGVVLRLTKVRTPVTTLLESSGALDAIGAENLLPGVPAAMIAHLQTADHPVSAEEMEAVVRRIEELTEILDLGESEMTPGQRDELVSSLHRLRASLRDRTD